MNRIVQFFHKTVSPEYFYWLSGKLIPWCIGIFVVLLAFGMWGAFAAPTDYQQGERV